MRVEFNISAANVPDDRINSNIIHARSLGLPIMARQAGGGVINVIGRGPSVADHADFLRTSTDINWAAGTAWAWCRDNGIPATAVWVDALPGMTDYVRGCKSAILHPQCDPGMFAALSDSDLKMVPPECEEYGSTAATQAAFLAAAMGHEVRLFGCEGSYAETTHVNGDAPPPNEMFIRANGQVFRTNAQMLIQSEQFAIVICMTTRPVFFDRSGGLLGALIATGGDWDFERWDSAPGDLRELIERSVMQRAAE